MPSPRPSAVAITEYRLAGNRELMAPQALATIAPADALHGDAAMYKLSKRLWSIEVHRRLEIQTRRALEA
ncbi:hypothetical protein [Beijerinckia sp. L45]|uniref:hypothetical protein n=1 Tax=Beijerinckia sp. L45 TaxID=1641855 RepID=UPI00131DB0DC|nr:hypothetical protein [Beijerinckia sp. L45]